MCTDRNCGSLIRDDLCLSVANAFFLCVSVPVWRTKMKITSRDNSLLRRARAVRDGKIEESIFVEGLRLCEEALSSGLNIEGDIHSEEIVRKERAAQLIAEL